MTILSRVGPIYDPNKPTSTPRMSFIYIGFVKDNKDTQYMGRLSVWIPEIGGDPSEPSSWITVSYASPFAGATDWTKVKDAQDMDSSQKSYGWWGIPPDLNNEVAVFFANGDIIRGYWFACTYQQNMNHMVPGVAVGDSKTGGSSIGGNTTTASTIGSTIGSTIKSTVSNFVSGIFGGNSNSGSSKSNSIFGSSLGSGKHLTLSPIVQTDVQAILQGMQAATTPVGGAGDTTPMPFPADQQTPTPMPFPADQQTPTPMPFPSSVGSAGNTPTADQQTPTPMPFPADNTSGASDTSAGSGTSGGSASSGKSQSPVVEYNKLNVTDVEKPLRPVFTPLAQGLKTEGLMDDKERGIATTSARREAPSKVFGYLTPRSNTIHVDDNEKNEFIRLRTRSGTQVLISETTGFVYINSKLGNAWIEVSDACVDIYSKTTVSIRAEKDVNIRADQNIILDAGKDINMRAANNITMECGNDMQIKVGHDYNLSVKNNGNISIGKVFNLKSGENLNLQSSNKDVNIKATANLNQEATANINMTAKGKFNRDAKSGIYDNSGGAGGAAGAGGSSASGIKVAPSDNPVVAKMQSQIGNNGAQENAFIHANGGTLDSANQAWCGGYAGAVLTSQGLQVPANPNSAASWVGFGSPVTGAPQAGDIMANNSHVGVAVGGADGVRTWNGQTQYLMVSGNWGGKVDYGWVNSSSVTVSRAPARTT